WCITATRSSCAVVLTRMSSFTEEFSRKRRAAPSFLDPLGGRAVRSAALGAFQERDGMTRLAQQPGGLVKRQAHDTGVRSLDAADEGRREPLDRVAAGLAERLAAR